MANFLGQCLMPCSGNSAELCGGPNALSVYQACTSTSCSNVFMNVNGTTVSSKRDLNRRHLADVLTIE